jgi:hypothetical protein
MNNCRYILWYQKKHFGRIIIGALTDVFVEAKDALDIGERMKDKGEIIDYNYSIIFPPPFQEVKNELDSTPVYKPNPRRATVNLSTR